MVGRALLVGLLLSLTVKLSFPERREEKIVCFFG